MKWSDVKPISLDLWKLSHGVDDHAPVDMRGKSHWVKRHFLKKLLCEAYRKSPSDFHAKTGRFVTDRLLERIYEDINRSPSLYRGYPQCEKTIRKVINDAVADGSIPNFV